ncbi:MAG TPA: DUF3224 domain-containing protein [Terriglobales bacterium]
MHKVSGPFDVKVAPQSSDKKDGSDVGRFSLDKQYHGALDATGKGEMLTAGTAMKGSAAYVAIERVEGTLEGRKGSFILRHTGTMDRGKQSLQIAIVPDSGAGDLAGISGDMNIVIAPDGKHSYELQYEIKPPQ